MSAQEAVYLILQIPLTKYTRDIVFINTSTPEERIFLLKLKSVQKFCLADYVSKVDVIYPKGDKLPGKLEEKKMMMAMMKVVLVMTMKTVWKMRMMLIT